MRSNSPPAGQLRSREVDSDLISCWVSLCTVYEGLSRSAYFLVPAVHKHTDSEQLGLNEELVMCSATETSDLGLSNISVLKKA